MDPLHVLNKRYDSMDVGGALVSLPGTKQMSGDVWDIAKNLGRVTVEIKTNAPTTSRNFRLCYEYVSVVCQTRICVEVCL